MRTRPMRITVTVEPAEVPWSDVLAAVRVEPDDMSEAPWDNCTGFDHTADTTQDDFPDREDSVRYISRSRREGGNVWLTLTPSADDANWQWFHARGASKQVARELAAHDLRTRYAQLAKWYAQGWEWWAVCGELKDCHASVGGVDDYKYAAGECTQDIAGELAAELERAGFLVTDRPEVVKVRRKPEGYYTGGVNSFNVCRR